MDEILKINLVEAAAKEMATRIETEAANPAMLHEESWALLRKTLRGTSFSPNSALFIFEKGFEEHLADLRKLILDMAKAEMAKAVEEATLAQAEYVKFLGGIKAETKELLEMLEKGYGSSREEVTDVYPELVQYLDRQNGELLVKVREMNDFFFGVAKMKYELRLKACFILLSDETVQKFVDLYQIEVE